MLFESEIVAVILSAVPTNTSSSYSPVVNWASIAILNAELSVLTAPRLIAPCLSSWTFKIPPFAIKPEPRPVEAFVKSISPLEFALLVASKIPLVNFKLLSVIDLSAAREIVLPSVTAISTVPPAVFFIIFCAIVPSTVSLNLRVPEFLISLVPVKPVVAVVKLLPLLISTACAMVLPAVRATSPSITVFAFVPEPVTFALRVEPCKVKVLVFDIAPETSPPKVKSPEFTMFALDTSPETSEVLDVVIVNNDVPNDEPSILPLTTELFKVTFEPVLPTVIIASLVLLFVKIRFWSTNSVALVVKS